MDYDTDDFDIDDDAVFGYEEVNTLILACENDDIDEVRRILAADEEDIHEMYRGMTAIHTAVLRGSIPIVKVLLEYGANINDTNSTRGDTPLHLATTGGDFAMVQFLLERGADRSIQ